ncbi:MAG TPA: Ig-like domain-containing protein [Candidatus Acidoferrum sp.]|jgi:hypothetical protein|nr:Ig-like domain-containing protein [Candidatus Acidoferrum sp.]
MRRRGVRFAGWLGALWISLTLSAFAQTTTNVTLAWNPSPASDVAGYRLYYGFASQTYTSLVSVANVTNAAVAGLVRGTTYYFTATTLDSLGLESQPSSEITYTVPTNSTSSVSTTTNTAPTISGIAGQTIAVNTATPVLSFTVADQETPATNLTVAATSSNPTLAPNSSMILGGTGTNRTITVTPAAGQTGTATIALTVCDPTLCTTTNFLLTVTALPTVTLTSPANGASYAAPATINLAATANANGHTVTAVRFYNGTALMGQATAAPYTFTWNNVPAGGYNLIAQAVYDAGNTVASSSVTVAVQGLWPPWQTMDIGTVGVPGNAAISNGLYAVQGAGNVSGSADNFRFLYQSLSGDGEIRGQILSAQNTGAGDLTSTMIRESLTSGSKYALMGLSPGIGYRWQRRNNTGGGTSSTKSGSGTPPNVWARLVRTGNTLSGYKSANGTNWTLVNSSTITMATNIYIGFAVASGSTATLNTTLFTNVTVVP